MSNHREISISEAKPQDASLLSGLARRTFFNSYAAYNTPENMNRYLEEHFSETIQREQILYPFNKIFIVWNNLKPIGYAHLRMSEDSNNQRVKLVRFYVEQEWHSKGVAHLMMGACLDWSCKQGFREIWLGVWEKNNRAQAFYRKWGFNQTGSNPFQFGTDVHLDYTFSRKISERDEGKFKQMNLNLA